MLEQTRRGLELYSETLFLTALNICATSGDYHTALRVFDLYEDRFGVVQQKAYSLVLVSYISSSYHEGPKDDNRNLFINTKGREMKFFTRKKKALDPCKYPRGGDEARTDHRSGIKTTDAPPKLISLVQFLVNSNLDHSNVALASLILNFKAMQGNVTDANSYFARITSLRHNKSPSSASLITYADLLRNEKKWTLARDLVLYMDKKGMIPFPRLKRYVESSDLKNRPLWISNSQGDDAGLSQAYEETEEI